MKNIHLLPTDKPSRLVTFFTNKFHLCKEILPIQDEEQYQHIYITNDEEIKEDDWGLSKLNEVILFGRSYNEKFYKKIILTTDQDLIADGVQSIDDEFLEWFVKNPSCESVEVKKRYSDFTVEPFVGYEIIIPQEEPKFVTVDIESALGEDLGKVSYIPLSGVDYVPKEEPKQETLEEAAEKRIPTSPKVWDLTETRRSDFIAGAKSDAARDYWFKIFKEQFIVSSSGK
jgi:hypothetical protein